MEPIDYNVCSYAELIVVERQSSLRAMKQAEAAGAPRQRLPYEAGFVILLTLVTVLLVGRGMLHNLWKSNAPLAISVEEQPTMFRDVSESSGKEVTRGIYIFTDGSCVIRNFKGEEVEKQLSEDKVRGLLRFFEQKGLFAMSNSSVERAINRGLQPIRTELPDGGVRVSFPTMVVVTHANYTKIFARTGSRSVEISRYALPMEADSYPKVTESRTIQRCVEKVYQVAGAIE